MTAMQAARAAALRDAGLPMPQSRLPPPPNGSELRLCLVAIGKIAANVSKLSDAVNANGGEAKNLFALEKIAQDVAEMRRMMASTLRVGADT